MASSKISDILPFVQRGDLLPEINGGSMVVLKD
jgi:hypothetical protein